MKTRSFSYILSSLLLIAFVTLPSYAGAASLIDELKSKFDDRSSKLKELEQEIQEYQQKINKTSQEAQTLQGTLKVLDTSKKKVTSEIGITQNKIELAHQNLESLSNQITEQERSMELQAKALEETIRKVQKTDDTTLVEAVLSEETLSSFLNESDSLDRFQNTVRQNLANLRDLKENLSTTKTLTEQKQHELTQYKAELDGKKKAVEYSAQEKAKLLADTKNQEALYKKLVAEKVAKKKAFEEELLQIESQLKLAVDPSKLPTTSSHALAWPLASVKITQYFGTTPFSTQNPQVYNGNGHNAIDLGTPIGTRVMSAAAGIVAGTGDTDKVCAGASYGRWVLVKHTNGLSTLYAHLSVISVSTGQSVSAGDLVGLSGNTGYSTGPHLHFAVFATEGMKVGSYKSKACGGTYTMPLADQKAYLNPLSYLPAL